MSLKVAKQLVFSAVVVLAVGCGSLEDRACGKIAKCMKSNQGLSKEVVQKISESCQDFFSPALADAKCSAAAKSFLECIAKLPTKKACEVNSCVLELDKDIAQSGCEKLNLNISGSQLPKGDFPGFDPNNIDLPIPKQPF